MFMVSVTDVVKIFFEKYEHGTNTLDIAILSDSYSDSFMFAGPQGVQTVKKDDFLKLIPQRKGFFQMLGLTSSTIISLEETKLDDQYTLIKTQWKMRYEKAGSPPIEDENSASYILATQSGKLQIVFQLDHQDLMKKAEALGLFPLKDK